MWFLIYIFLFNSSASQKGFVNMYRVSLGVTQIGIIEISLAFGLIYALFSGGARFARYPNGRTHPALVVTLSCMGAAFMCGILGAIFNEAPLAHTLRNAREYLALPVTIIIGYRCLPDPKAAWKLAYIMVIAGCLAATMTLYRFFAGAEEVKWGASWNLVRSIDFVPAYAGLASVLLFYSLVNRRVKLAPFWVTFALGGYCILGQFAPMHRSEWVAITLSFIVAIPLLPPDDRFRAVLKTIVVVPLVAGVLALGVQLGSWATQRDYSSVVIKRIISLLPTERKGTEAKAWDTRLGSTNQELRIWLENPLLGRGFATQFAEVERGQIRDSGAYFHNGWASVLATTGIFGLVAVATLLGSLGVIGFRLARDATDRGTLWIGLLSYCSAFYLLVQVASTMIWTTRSVMLFGTLAGMMFRCRDMQATTLALQQSNQQDDEVWLYENGWYDAEGQWIPASY